MRLRCSAKPRSGYPTAAAAANARSDENGAATQATAKNSRAVLSGGGVWLNLRNMGEAEGTPALACGLDRCGHSGPWQGEPAKAQGCRYIHALSFLRLPLMFLPPFTVGDVRKRYSMSALSLYFPSREAMGPHPSLSGPHHCISRFRRFYWAGTSHDLTCGSFIPGGRRPTCGQCFATGCQLGMAGSASPAVGGNWHSLWHYYSISSAGPTVGSFDITLWCSSEANRVCSATDRGSGTYVGDSL